MQRMFGMMPANMVSISKTYKDQYGMQITVQAGSGGWTVLWADGSSNYGDNITSPEENFEAALRCVKSYGFDLTEVKEHAADVR